VRCSSGSGNLICGSSSASIKKLFVVTNHWIVLKANDVDEE
jgi:hypothetical protein